MLNVWRCEKYGFKFSKKCSLAQEPACKDLGRNGQSPAITPKAAYTPAPNRASSRSLKCDATL
ncbi:hypothetical protein FEZ34_04190 [Lacticaseibacillus casei]|nr:hypothetical protein FEZ34_04190 [Lacticaseibacillus casei]